jgi:hypothetical protein
MLCERVTNAERFAPLHDFAAQLIGRLEDAFDVDREEGVGLDDELEAVGRFRFDDLLVGEEDLVRPTVVAPDLPRPTVRLTPRREGAAGLTIVFSRLPGLWARFGRWHVEGFPMCACDACDETAAGESDRLSDLVESVTAGAIGHTVVVRFDGSISFQTRIGLTSVDRVLQERDRSLRDAAVALLAGRDRADWVAAPWPARSST